MDQRISNLAPVIWEKIQDSSRGILLHLHPRADFDSLGSALGLREVLERAGKRVTVIRGDTALPSFAQFLPGAAHIKPQTYEETRLEDFDLFIILDTSDKGRISERGEVTFPQHLTTIAIDHHVTTKDFAGLNLVVSSASSTSEILADLVARWGVPMSPDVAFCFLVGIYGDTGHFIYPSTSSHTLEVAARLIAMLPDFSARFDNILNNENFTRLLFQGIGLIEAERFFEDRLIISAISRKALDEHGVPLEDTANNGLATILRSVTGCWVAVTLVEEEPGKKIKFSSRSRGVEFGDVSKLAAFFGGGGHRTAAGAIILGKTLEETKEEVKKAFAALFLSID